MTTATAARYTAARVNGRYRVIDTTLPEGANIVGTRASRAKAEEAAAVLNAEAAPAPVRVTAPALSTAEQMDAALAYVASLEEDPAPAEESPADQREEAASVLAEAVAAGRVSFDAAAAVLLSGATGPEVTAAAARIDAAPLPVVTLDGEETAVEVTPTPAVTAAAAWVNPHAKTPALLPSQGKAAARKPGRKADPDTRGLWVVIKLAAIIMESTDPAYATIVRKLKAATPNGQGGRTIRLTREEAVTLAAIATEIETAVLDESLEWENRGRLANSCASMRTRATALWA